MPFLYLLKNIPNYNLELIISIIIPAYNSEATIEKCVHSLTSQSFPREKFEVIVVDDCSTDKTADLAKAAGANHVMSTEKNSGQGPARNLGVKNSKGKFLAFTDSDCIAKDDWIKNIVEELQTQQVIGGPIVNGNPQSTIAWAEYFFEFSFFHENKKRTMVRMVPACNIACTKEIFSKVGGFKGSYGIEDVLFGSSIRQIGMQTIFIPNVQMQHLCRTTLHQVLPHMNLLGKNFVKTRRIEPKEKYSFWFKNKLFIPIVFFGQLTLITKYAIKAKKTRKFLKAFPIILLANFSFAKGIWEELEKKPQNQE